MNMKLFGNQGQALPTFWNCISTFKVGSLGESNFPISFGEANFVQSKWFFAH
jgi:hypothetical protein